MKKLRLRKWVKFSLLGMAVMTLFALNNSYYKKTIQQCVNNGHEYSYCMEGLR